MPQELATSARTLSAGVKIAGRLTLLRCVATGGMGSVWAARNEMTGAEVAVKVLRPGSDTSAQAVARFRHEAKLGAMMAHRNLVRVFDLIEEPDGSLVLVMELLRGQTLKSYMAAKGPLSNREAVSIVLAILAALQHAHELGIVHRDVKPENIFLSIDPDGHVTPKLLDFGIAKVSEGPIQTLEGHTLGTPSHMSPEQIRANVELDGRSDLFAIGVVLYETIAGICPFAATSPSAALASVLESAVDPHPSIEPRVWLEIQRALAKQPYERHASAVELSKALCQALGETEAELIVSLRRSKPPSRAEVVAATTAKTLIVRSVAMTGKPKRPRRKTLVAGGVGLLLVALIASMAFRRPSNTQAATPPPVPPQVSRMAEEIPPAPIAATPSAPAPRPPKTASPPTRRVPHRSPKPIATTPGF